MDSSRKGGRQTLKKKLSGKQQELLFGRATVSCLHGLSSVFRYRMKQHSITRKSIHT